jgi:hypothetical protein
MATVKFTYKQDVDTVFAFVSDPEVAKQRSIDMGERDVKVTKDGEAVTNVRTVDAEVPGFAAKLLKPSNTVLEVKRWSSATKSARMSVDVKGAPTQIEGTIKLTPNGGGCDYALDFTVTCKIPLIGGKLAAYVEGITKKGMQEEFEWNQRKLNERAG